MKVGQSHHGILQTSSTAFLTSLCAFLVTSPLCLKCSLLKNKTNCQVPRPTCFTIGWVILKVLFPIFTGSSTLSRVIKKITVKFLWYFSITPDRPTLSHLVRENDTREKNCQPSVEIQKFNNVFVGD